MDDHITKPFNFSDIHNVIIGTKKDLSLSNLPSTSTFTNSTRTPLSPADLSSFSSPAATSGPLPAVQIRRGKHEPYDSASAVEQLGSADLLEKTVRRLLEDQPQTILKMTTAVDTGDQTEAHRLAHSLVGLSKCICASRLTSSAQSMEAAATGLGANLSHVKAIQHEYAQIRDHETAKKQNAMQIKSPTSGMQWQCKPAWALIDSIQDMILVLTDKDVIAYVNVTLRQTLGMSNIEHQGIVGFDTSCLTVEGTGRLEWSRLQRNTNWEIEWNGRSINTYAHIQPVTVANESYWLCSVFEELRIGREPRLSVGCEMDATKSLNILIVEDDAAQAEVAHALCVQCGHRGDIAATGTEALQRLKAVDPEEYDLVLLDMLLPDMTAAPLVSELRSAVSSTLTVVTISASSDLLLARDSVHNGSDGYISKPLRKQDVETLWLYNVRRARDEHVFKKMLRLQAREVTSRIFEETLNALGLLIMIASNVASPMT